MTPAEVDRYCIQAQSGLCMTTKFLPLRRWCITFQRPGFSNVLIYWLRATTPDEALAASSRLPHPEDSIRHIGRAHEQ